MLTIKKINSVMKAAKISELYSSGYKLRGLLFKYGTLKTASWSDNWRNSSDMFQPTEEDSITFSDCVSISITPSKEAYLKVRLSIWNGDSCHGQPTTHRCEFYFHLTRSFKQLDDLLFHTLVNKASCEYEAMLEKQRQDFIKTWVGNILKETK